MSESRPRVDVEGGHSSPGSADLTGEVTDEDVATWDRTVGEYDGALIGGIVAGAVSGPEPYGPIPDSAFSSDGIDLSQVPALVAVSGPGGEVAGYVSEADLFEQTDSDAPSSPDDAVAVSGTIGIPLTVFDASGETVVGYWYDYIGYVTSDVAGRPDFDPEVIRRAGQGD